MTKKGDGTLTLDTVASTYSGYTSVERGTQALGAGGSISNTSGLGLAVGGDFNISGMTPGSMTLPRLDVNGPNAFVTADSKSLNLNNADITFDITGVGAGQTMLRTDNVITIDYTGQWNHYLYNAAFAGTASANAT